MSQVNRSYTQEVVVGLFMATVFAVLIFFTVIISGMDLLHGRNRIKRTVRFDNVGSLRVQDSVIVRGVPVGSVQDLTLDDGCIKATILIDEKVSIYKNYSIKVVSASVLGGSRLDIDAGSSESGEPLPTTALLTGESPVDMMEQVGALVSDLRQAVNPEDVRTIITNLRTTSSAISSLTTRLEAGQGTIGKLLSPDETLYGDLKETMANLKALSVKLSGEQSMVTDLEASAKSLRIILNRVEAGQGTIGKLLSADDSLYGDLKETMGNLNKITTKFSGDDASLLKDLESSAKSLRIVLQRLEAGEGTLGKLSKDDQIAVEIEGAVKDVRQIIDNMRDTAPITTFTSIFFGGM